jgi:hypothetical protein
MVCSYPSEIATYYANSGRPVVTNIMCTGRVFCSRCDRLTHHTAVARNFFLYCLLKHTLPYMHAHIILPRLYLSFHGVDIQKPFLLCWRISMLQILFTMWGMYNWNLSQDALWVMVLQQLELQYVFRQKSHWCTGWHTLSAKTYFGYCLNLCFSTAGPRPGTRPWHQLYRAARVKFYTE